MDEEGYLALRWNNHNAVFSRILSLLREQEVFTDVSLASDGKLFAAHKFVLSTCSDFFRDMFMKNPCKHPIIFLKDVPAKDVESLLDFMYKGEAHVPQSELGSLLRTAEGLQVKGLAVPDDALLLSRVQNTSSVSSKNLTKTANYVQPHFGSFPVKRKQPIDSNRRDCTSNQKSSLMNGQQNNSNRAKLTKERKHLHSEGYLKSTHTTPDKKRLKTEKPDENNQKPMSGTEFPTLKNVDNQIFDQSEMKENIGVNTGHVNTEIKGDPDTDTDFFDVTPIKEEIHGTRMNDNDAVILENMKDIVDEEEQEDEEEEEVEDEEREEEEESCTSEGTRECSPLSSEDVKFDFTNQKTSSTDGQLKISLNDESSRQLLQLASSGMLVTTDDTASIAEVDSKSSTKKPFVCILCGHSFTRRDNLANHLKTHTGDRPYMCQYCKKCFSRKDYLKQHERIHTGEKPYSCDVCHRAFTRKEGLTDHMRCHSDFKEFECETCGKCFKQKCGLRFHKRNYRH